MRLVRLLSAVLLVGALGYASAHSTLSVAQAPLDALCSPAALTQNLIRVHGVENYGCEGKWAFLWVNVGISGRIISITDVLQFNDVTKRWMPVSRLKVCRPSVLPKLVYERGCFSN